MVEKKFILHSHGNTVVIFFLEYSCRTVKNDVLVPQFTTTQRKYVGALLRKYSMFLGMKRGLYHRGERSHESEPYQHEPTPKRKLIHINSMFRNNLFMSEAQNFLHLKKGGGRDRENRENGIGYAAKHNS